MQIVELICVHNTLCYYIYNLLHSKLRKTIKFAKYHGPAIDFSTLPRSDFSYFMFYFLKSSQFTDITLNSDSVSFTMNSGTCFELNVFSKYYIKYLILHLYGFHIMITFLSAVLIFLLFYTFLSFSVI